MLLATAQKKMSAYLEGGGATMTERDGKHIYGDGLPSASEILRIFSFGDFAFVDQDKLEEAAHIGTAVHATIADIFNEKITDIDDMILEDERYMNCMKAFNGWRNGKNIIPLAVERTFLSELLGFGGTIDIVAFVDGKLSLIDWKTSNEVSFKHFVQLRLYAMLLKECTGILVDDLCLLYLNKETGEFKERRCPDRKKSRAFAKKVLRFRKQTEEFKRIVDGRRRLTI